MPIEIVLTSRNCVCLMLLLFGVVYLIVFGILAELSVEQINESKSLLKSYSKNNWKPPGANSDHLHVFVQISDLHLSAFNEKARGTDLLKFCSHTLDIIRPEVVILTGDITDAKLENLEGSQQILDEWIEYKSILIKSKILNKTVWLDTRGNHDAFDVPSLSSKENLFKTFSVQGHDGQLSYHYRHRTQEGDVISFIAVDACLDPGPKRPFNFFGMLKGSEMKKLKEFIDDSSRHSNATIFFGHYPSSVISSHSSAIIRDFFKTGIAYLCGHLHTFAGLVPQMYAYQREGYLELELGDWKHERLYRVIVMDNGLFSFVDVPVHDFPIIIITNPKDERFLIWGKEPIQNIEESRYIRILIFSDGSIEKVLVTVDGSPVGHAYNIKRSLYVLPWDAKKYNKGYHHIEVSATDSTGKTTKVKQGFSMDGTQSGFTFIQRFILIMDHTFFFKAFFVFTYLLSLLPLIFFKLFKVQIIIMVQSRVSSCILRFFQRWLRRFCLLSARPRLFYPLLAYNIYLICGPWFIGYILSDHIGACFLYGLVVDGQLLLTSLTYLYGALQMLQFNIPLTFYLAFALDRTVTKQGRGSEGSCSCWRTCSSKTHRLFLKPARHIVDHLFFFAVISFQAYLVLSGFLKSYGFLAFLLCPLRTWAIILALFLHYYIVRDKSPSSSLHDPANQSAGVLLNQSAFPDSDDDDDGCKNSLAIRERMLDSDASKQHQHHLPNHRDIEGDDTDDDGETKEGRESHLEDNIGDGNCNKKSDEDE